MTIEDVLKLVDAGFTREEIAALSAPAGAAIPDPEPQPAPAQPAGANPAQAQAAADDIQKDILAALRDLKTAVQASNTRRDLGAGQKTETVEDILSSILNNGEVK
ncbi:MAG: hypothetical protein IIY19_06780 [Lachnospiraceae bacterium]|nr:hypothetical protein [Lachnospiraceae bacterium]